jgi:hypothetical protein
LGGVAGVDWRAKNEPIGLAQVGGVLKLVDLTRDGGSGKLNCARRLGLCLKRGRHGHVEGCAIGGRTAGIANNHLINAGVGGTDIGYGQHAGLGTGDSAVVLEGNAISQPSIRVRSLSRMMKEIKKSLRTSGDDCTLCP